MGTMRNMPAMMSGLLFSPSGTIDRAGFVGGSLVLSAVALAGDQFARSASDPYGLVPFVFALGVAWVAGCLSRKRLHDLGRSGWLIIAFLAAYIAIVLTASFSFDLQAHQTYWRVTLHTLAFAGPMIAWFVALAMLPGEAARQAARRAWSSEALPSVAVGGQLRAGRM